MILIPFGTYTLALSEDAFHQALKDGGAFLPSSPMATPSTPEILDAEGMQARTGVPSSWFLQAAREGRIPSIEFGKYRRFNFAAVLAAMSDDRLIGRPAVVAKVRKSSNS